MYYCPKGHRNEMGTSKCKTCNSSMTIDLFSRPLKPNKTVAAVEPEEESPEPEEDKEFQEFLAFKRKKTEAAKPKNTYKSKLLESLMANNYDNNDEDEEEDVEIPKIDSLSVTVDSQERGRYGGVKIENVFGSQPGCEYARTEKPKKVDPNKFFKEWQKEMAPKKELKITTHSQRISNSNE